MMMMMTSMSRMTRIESHTGCQSEEEEEKEKDLVVVVFSALLGSMTHHQSDETHTDR